MRIPTKAAQIVASEGEQRSHFSLLFCTLFSVEDWTFSQQFCCRQEALGKSVTKENTFFQPPTLPYSCSNLAHVLFLFSLSKYTKGEHQAYIIMLYPVLSSWNKFSIYKPSHSSCLSPIWLPQLLISSTTSALQAN